MTMCLNANCWFSETAWVKFQVRLWFIFCNAKFPRCRQANSTFAGTDRGYKCTGRRAVGLVQLLEGTTKALYCLCAHYAVLKVVPIDYSFWKELIFPDVCLTLDEFEGSRVVYCLSIYYIWCFKSFVLFCFSLSFVPYFFQIVFWCDGGHQSLNHFVKHS